jgi:hypothetical protein
MSLDFGSMLTTEQKVDIINQRITQFASEAYQLQLNRQSAEKLDRQDQIEIIDSNLKLLEAAVILHREELATLQ